MQHKSKIDHKFTNAFFIIISGTASDNLKFLAEKRKRTRLEPMLNLLK